MPSDTTPICRRGSIWLPRTLTGEVHVPIGGAQSGQLTLAKISPPHLHPMDTFVLSTLLDVMHVPSYLGTQVCTQVGRVL